MSLRVRLLLAVGAVALVALIAADVATYSSLRSFLYQRVDRTLDALARRGPPGSDALEALGSGVYAEIRYEDGRVLAQPGRLPDGKEFAPTLPQDVGTLEASGGHEFDTARHFTSGDARVRASLGEHGDTFLVALPLDDTRDTLRRLLGIELIVTAGALGAALALGWWLVQLGLQPLAAVEATAVEIAEGDLDLDRRAPGADSNTEVGKVARALNTMLGRIQDAFAERDATEARLRRFVADASHELRTPLAAVSAYAELFDRGANDRPEDLGRVMTGIRSEAGRMTELVEDLFLLARLDEGLPLSRQPVDLVALAGAAVDAAVAVGPEWPVTVQAAQPVEVSGDPTRLRQVIDNLLANVRAHTPQGTSATVSVSADESGAVLKVADTGPGLSDEAVARVFERFYRADPSRSRQNGGAGLGLAIVAAIVAAHGGSVHVEDPSPAAPGTTFVVHLPVL